MTRMTMSREETRSTVVSYRDSDSESEPEQLRSVSDLNCSRAVTRRRALPWTLLRSHTCRVAIAGTLWSGMGETKRSPRVMTTVGDAVADEQHRRSPRLQTCQAGPGAKDAPVRLGHPSLGSDPHREGSKFQNKLLQFLTSLLENFFLAVTQQANMPSHSSESQNRQSEYAKLQLSVSFKISNLKI